MSAAPNAICRTHFLGSRVCESRVCKAIKNASSNPSPAQVCVPRAFSRRPFCHAGKVDAEEEAAMVTVAVLLLSSAPTEQVTPASVLETLQEKVTLFPESPLMGVKLSVDVALLPGFIVKVVGEALSEKSPGTVVKLKTLDQAPYTPPEEDKALTCQ